MYINEETKKKCDEYFKPMLEKIDNGKELTFRAGYETAFSILRAVESDEELEKVKEAEGKNVVRYTTDDTDVMLRLVLFTMFFNKMDYSPLREFPDECNGQILKMCCEVEKYIKTGFKDEQYIHLAERLNKTKEDGTSN